MPVPTRRERLQWAERYVSLWNAGDKDAWIANWRSIAPGAFRMLDPVGTPEKQGFAACCTDSWDLFQARVRFRIVSGTLFVNGDEVAWCLENHLTTDGRTSIAHSIETYRFDDAGNVTIRTYYRIPEKDDSELGRMFETYLPSQV